MLKYIDYLPTNIRLLHLVQIDTMCFFVSLVLFQLLFMAYAADEIENSASLKMHLTTDIFLMK